MQTVPFDTSNTREKETEAVPVQEGADRCAVALIHAGLSAEIKDYGRASSLEDAARLRGVPPAMMIKTLVVRAQGDRFYFVLVPGDRQISWPKLRELLGTSRMSLPDAKTALAVTGFERGTITPFGSLNALPTIVDASIGDLAVLGAGGHGLSVTLRTDDVIRALNASVADVTIPIKEANGRQQDRLSD